VWHFGLAYFHEGHKSQYLSHKAQKKLFYDEMTEGRSHFQDQSAILEKLSFFLSRCISTSSGNRKRRTSIIIDELRWNLSARSLRKFHNGFNFSNFDPAPGLLTVVLEVLVLVGIPARTASTYFVQSN
jgi:hypothetical protein